MNIMTLKKMTYMGVGGGGGGIIPNILKFGINPN